MKLPEYDDWDATEMADKVRNREVSSKELMEAALQRIEARNPALNAVVRTVESRARERLPTLPDGPLTGVPFLLKDLKLQLAGTVTSNSTRLDESRVAQGTSVLAQRYEDAGLVVLGKTNTPEFGIMGITEPDLHGPARNPWNTDCTPGGSSGGAASAVAARMVPVAHGGDGGGSIRIPASCCGLFGLKPTRGRVSMAPFAGESWSGFVQEHVLARSVRDSALLLDIAAQPTPGEPYAAPAVSRPFIEEVGVDPGKLKIAVTESSLYGTYTHDDCVAAVRDAADLLRDLGHELVEAVPPFPKEEMIRAYFIVVCTGISRFVETTAERAGVKPRAKDFEVPTWLMAQIGWSSSASKLLWAQGTIQRVSRDVAGFFETYDGFLTSTIARPPARVGEMLPSASERFQMRLLQTLSFRPILERALDEIGGEKIAYTPNTQLFNQTGQPAMSVPLFWNQEGLPIGVQIAGRFGEEALLLRLASQLEEARPWANRKPAL
jgi:amidase